MNRNMKAISRSIGICPIGCLDRDKMRGNVLIGVNHLRRYMIPIGENTVLVRRGTRLASGAEAPRETFEDMQFLFPRSFLEVH